MLGILDQRWFPLVAAAIACSSPISSAHSQQRLPGFFGIFGGIINAAIVDSARRQWQSRRVADYNCLTSRNLSADQLAARGIGPNDPRIRQILYQCAQASRSAPERIEPRLVVGPYNPNFVVDGLALGGDVYPDSAVYKSYTCRPSGDFAGFTWCSHHRERSGKFGSYTSWVTILHSSTNKVVFITEAVTPAFFAPGDVDREIARVSNGFGQAARTLTADVKPGLPRAFLAAWGAVTLTPLDEAAMDSLRGGEQIHRGLIADFIGDARKSARIGLPVYSLGGGQGYLWGANFDDAGRGSLRLSAVDASEVGPAPAEATRTPSPTPSPVPTPEPQPPTANSGTGFFITSDGSVITNAHVVRDCSEIHVATGQGNYVVAHLVARDTTNDLALLKVDVSPSHVASLRLAVRLGENIEAFGYPLSQVLATTGNFTTGNVTALAGIRDDSRYLQISAPVQPGNSGGPLLDENGNLVGIVSSKLNFISEIKDVGDIPQNVNFAIKASIAANFLQDNYVKFQIGDATQIMKAADLADQAKALSVYIECR